MAAVRRGNELAIHDPEEATQTIEEFPEEEALSREEIEAEAGGTLPLLSETMKTDPKAVSFLVAWMHDQGMIQRKLPVSSLVTNRYLSKP
jgi:ABC-type nitrate/sulfonate/bicarbonate transport system substrate-binding protein